MMALSIFLISPVVHRFIHSGRLAGAAAIGLGGLVYLLGIFLVGGVTEADLGLIPGVRPGWITALRRRRLLRA
jgi:hypothetical protein